MQRTRIRPFALCLLITAMATAMHANAQSWTFENIIGPEYKNEPMSLQHIPIPADAQTGDFVVTANGKEIAYFVDTDPVTAKKYIWIGADIPGKPKNADPPKVIYKVTKGKSKQFPQRVTVKDAGDHILIDNGTVAMKITKSTGATDKVPGPIQSVKLPGGQWVGSSFWHTDRKLKKLTTTIVGDGRAFARINLLYEFQGDAGLNNNIPAFARISISLTEGSDFFHIDESHEMARGDYWELILSEGWQPNKPVFSYYQGGPNGDKKAGDKLDHLKAIAMTDAAIEQRYNAGDPRIEDRLIRLLPRWNQHYEDGWFCSVTDGKQAIGALVARAGKWYWPHNNAIEVTLKPDGDYAGLRCPTWKGRRYWLLITSTDGKQYLNQHAFTPLDKVANEFILDWPGYKGKKLGGFRSDNYFSSNINPTGFWRQMAKQAVKNAGKKGNLGTLTHFQTMMHPDMYGSYWLYWSPENPNFFSDFVKRPLGDGCQLRDHPQFNKIKQMAMQKMREDMYHAVTLPGGAGQECPGYQAHGCGAWLKLAPVFKKYYGFDITQWPRFKAVGHFLAKTSVPHAGDRYFHPGGDTHPYKDKPGRPGAMDVAKNFGYSSNPKSWQTEELPGFGIIFRDQPGTNDETYLAFKSGPNRGHYHGDQLSFHYANNANMVAVDHHCSYHPRAGQEHMHNRVVFHNDKYPYCNIDGYERVIAFKDTKDVDVAMGQVESERMRSVKKLPPEEWDTEYPRVTFDQLLKYRRTIVMVKNAGRPYFVIRDQAAGPDVKATFAMHVLGDKCEHNGDTIKFDQMTLFVATPKNFKFDRLDWSHHNGAEEKTKGIRLTTEGRDHQFITVIYPSGSKTPAMKAVDNGVQVGDDTIVFAGGIDDNDATTYVKVTRNGKDLLNLTGKDIDMDRSQGEIGLFVPDAGYPFGEIPDWLIRQRNKIPDWAPQWAKDARAHEQTTGK